MAVVPLAIAQCPDPEIPDLEDRQLKALHVFRKKLNDAFEILQETVDPGMGLIVLLLEINELEEKQLGPPPDDLSKVDAKRAMANVIKRDLDAIRPFYFRYKTVVQGRSSKIPDLPEAQLLAVDSFRARFHDAFKILATRVDPEVCIALLFLVFARMNKEVLGPPPSDISKMDARRAIAEILERNAAANQPLYYKYKPAGATLPAK